MQIIIVRHAEPNYTIDSITKKGKREAKLLCEKLCSENADYYYCSPLGRAKRTASYTMKKLKKQYEILPWLREFQGRVVEEDGKINNCWDRLPSYWTADERYYGENWYSTDTMKKLNCEKEYRKVCDEFDKLLAKHGYEHDGKIFRVKNSNHDKIVLFCHFGVECVLLSHLFSMSPMILWHNFVALPSSVTTIVTEEREEGIAVFRMTSFGDTGHLYKGNEQPSFMARFCECYSDKERH